MQVVFWVMFGVIIIVAGFFWIKYELECEHSSQLEEEIFNLNSDLKERTQLMMVGDIVQEYRKDMTHVNACTAMRKISDIFLKAKQKNLS